MTWLCPSAGLWFALLPLFIAGFGPAPRAQAQIILPPGATISRQVTLFAIRATPNDPSIDPKLKAIAPQLKRLMPNHGFQLLNVQSHALRMNQSISCKITDQLAAKADLVNGLGTDGKVQFRFSLQEPRSGLALATTLISTPPNQLFFCDKVLDDGTKVLIGIGAR